MSRFKSNVVANYISQIYVMFAGIVLLPMYIKYMGPEAYGLVGFYSVLQAWFVMLDLGLTPTIGRESARYRAGVITALKFRQLFRSLSLIFLGVAIIGGGALFCLSEYISKDWLVVQNIPIDQVVLAVQLMAISVSLRWMCGLYRGVITGSERLVWLSVFNAAIATLRFVGVFPVMWYYGFTPFIFFIWQFFIASLEILGLWLKANRLLPSRSNLDSPIGWSLKPVMSVLKFSVTIAFTSCVWVIATQTDKLVLSGVLSLDDYGYFSLAILVASGIVVIGGPISGAIMPRMANLHAKGQHDELITIYRRSTQLVTIIAGGATVTLVALAEPLLMVWTADPILANKTAPILQLYAVGNGFLSLAAFSYYLQYSRGELRYHLIGNIWLLIILLPSTIFAAKHYGSIGAGYVWCLMNFIYLFFWTWYVHNKLIPGLHGKWIWHDVLKIIIPTSVFSFVIFKIDFSFYGRLENFIFISLVSLVVLMIGTISSGLLASLRIKGFNHACK